MKEFLFDEESGQGMVEYGLILALVALAAIAVLATVGARITNTFTKADNSLESAGMSETTAAAGGH